MKSLSRLAVPLALVLAVPALGCGGSTTSGQTIAVAGGTRSPVAQSAHGQVKLVGEALGDVPLTAAQRDQIEKLAADADRRHDDTRSARKDLLLAIADEVQAGAIDRATLQPKVDALLASLDRALPADRAGLEQLHAILGADQRVAFVDALEARLGSRIGEMHAKHPMRQWVQDLKLSDDQQAQIKALIKPHFEGLRDHDGAKWGGEGRRHGAKVLEAFKQDRFVLDEVAPNQEGSRRIAAMSEHFLGVAALVLPVLTPEQRGVAAAKLRERAALPDGEGGLSF